MSKIKIFCTPETCTHDPHEGYFICKLECRGELAYCAWHIRAHYRGHQSYQLTLTENEIEKLIAAGEWIPSE